MIINSTPEYQVAMNEEEELIESKLPEVEKFDEFEEVREEVVVDTATGEITSESKAKFDDIEF